MLAPSGSASREAPDWAAIGVKLQGMWRDFLREQAEKPHSLPGADEWLASMSEWSQQFLSAAAGGLPPVREGAAAPWQGIFGQNGDGDGDGGFAGAGQDAQSLHAMLRQIHRMLAEQIMAATDSPAGIAPSRHEQLRFALRTLIGTLNPDNFPLTNPQVIERAIATRGESLVKGMTHLITDLRRGQLTHTDADAFRLGENIAVTPGKVVHETPLYQLIQYSPATSSVLAVPLIIFPPWINRFYILDLNPAKSFVRWAVEQGVTVFMVSWKSADASLAEVIWDDYVRAQIDAIDMVRARLKVPAVHTIGYCVAGTTLAATLAVLARRGEADRVKSATFFTAQVDFEEAGDLKHFIDDRQIEAIGRLAPEGYLDGRYLAAAFNLLRPDDLIWSYVVRNYLMGEDYPAFDLLHWNGDVTNLPAKWHCAYLRDLYRDNRLVEPDSLIVDGTPIDLHRIVTPCYIQAGREDHIAPPRSGWKLTRYLAGPWIFLLAGSGHIAGVVNPPAPKKYGYRTNAGQADTLEQFVAGADEHPGSWWPHWLGWLRTQDSTEVRATGKRKPGGRGDKAIEDAPGRYVKMR
ncbi:MAG: class I poly(R)-hydroxyalkanoic acid synthase [Novosphingobium sp.]|nr:class I poly(R)-hydroxyalkanoic acid synthase [Novosphingobium sp.]